MVPMNRRDVDAHHRPVGMVMVRRSGGCGVPHRQFLEVAFGAHGADERGPRHRCGVKINHTFLIGRMIPGLEPVKL